MHDAKFDRMRMSPTDINQFKKSHYGAKDTNSWQLKPWGPQPVWEMVETPLPKGTFVFLDAPSGQGKSVAIGRLVTDQY